MLRLFQKTRCFPRVFQPTYSIRRRYKVSVATESNLLLNVRGVINPATHPTQRRFWCNLFFRYCIDFGVLFDAITFGVSIFSWWNFGNCQQYFYFLPKRGFSLIFDTFLHLFLTGSPSVDRSQNRGRATGRSSCVSSWVYHWAVSFLVVENWAVERRLKRYFCV